MSNDLKTFIGFDLGAESGRTIAGILDDGKLAIEEIHRFKTGTITLNNNIHWNVYRFFEEMKLGLEFASRKVPGQIVSLGVDTWGVDFGFMDRNNNLIGLPYAYRDHRTDGIMEEMFSLLPRNVLYDLTGIQMMQINSVFQLLAYKKENAPVLSIADALLFIPDIFNYFFTGEKVTEFSFATTSQLYNPKQKNWSEEIFDLLGMPKYLMQPIVQPGSIIGELSRLNCSDLHIGKPAVAAVASHDTGSAVAAVPAEGNDWAFISSGTWSLMGVESDKPVITKKTEACNITNEGGFGGTFRILKNIMGLWLLQRYRHDCEDLSDTDYAMIMQQATNKGTFRSLIDPDAAELLNPANMREALAEQCKKHDQPEPETHAHFINMILESLALRYRYTLDQLREVYPYPINRIHVTGGGVKNELLCQFTANACGMQVIAGPVEASAIGNLLVQAKAVGLINDSKELRQVVRNSFPLKEYQPRRTEYWEEAYSKFRSIVNGER